MLDAARQRYAQAAKRAAEKKLLSGAGSPLSFNIGGKPVEVSAPAAPEAPAEAPSPAAPAPPAEAADPAAPAPPAETPSPAAPDKPAG